MARKVLRLASAARERRMWRIVATNRANFCDDAVENREAQDRPADGATPPMSRTRSTGDGARAQSTGQFPARSATLSAARGPAAQIPTDATSARNRRFIADCLAAPGRVLSSSKAAADRCDGGCNLWVPVEADDSNHSERNADQRTAASDSRVHLPSRVKLFCPLPLPVVKWAIAVATGNVRLSAEAHRAGSGAGWPQVVVAPWPTILQLVQPRLPGTPMMQPHSR